MKGHGCTLDCLQTLPGAFQSERECSPDYNAGIYGCDFFFNANDFHLWNKQNYY